MALNFYTSIDLNQNQLIQPRIENLGSDPSGVEGQIYFDTANDKLRVYAGGAWENVGDQGTDGVDTLAIAAAGTNSGGVNTSLVVNSPTGTVTLQPMQYGGGANIGMVPTGGTATTVMLGDGTWADYEQGDITGIDAGVGIVVNDPTTATPEVAVDYSGANNLIVSAGNGTAVTLVDADDFLFLDGDNDVKYGNLSQLKTYINAGNFNDFIISDGTTSQTIDDGETITFVRPDSSTNGLVNLTVSATNTVTANAIIGAAGVATASTLVHRDGSGNIWVTTVNGELTGTINTATTATTQSQGDNSTKVATTAYVDASGSGTMSSFIAAGDAGANQTITDGNTLLLSAPANTAAKGGIETVGVATDTIRFDLDLGGLTATSGFDGAADYLIISDGAAFNKRILPQYIPLNDWGIPDGNVAMGTNGGTLYNIIDLKDPVNLQDAATKNYVDVAVTGLLDFKGGFDASTGEITSGINDGLYLWGVARVAVAVGDLYIVAGSASGNFFGDSDYPLTPGDSVYGVNAVGANTSVVTDFAVAQADTDLATAGANAGAASLGISSYDSANFSVATGFVSITNVDLGTETTGNYTATVAADTTALYKGIRVSGATGEGQAAVVGFNLSGLTSLGAVPETNDELLILDESTNENKSVTVANLAGTMQDVNSYAATVTLAAGVAQTITHGLGTYDVIVQTYDATTYENIIVTVDRTGTTTITLKADTLPPNDVRCLIQKIIA